MNATTASLPRRTPCASQIVLIQAPVCLQGNTCAMKMPSDNLVSDLGPHLLQYSEAIVWDMNGCTLCFWFSMKHMPSFDSYCCVTDFDVFDYHISNG